MELVSIIIPAMNEQEVIGIVVRDIHEFYAGI